MSERSIPLENLEIWHRAAAENRALRLLQIAEMAKEPLPPREEDNGPLRLPLPDLACEAEIPSADHYARAMALDEQMALCRARLAKNAKAPAVGSLLPMPPAPRVARLAGAVFDSAFRRLLPLMGTARPVYLSSLNDLLEELAAGNADLAIFPMQDAKGVRFLHFYEEFDRLELHVTHTCDVLSEESGRPLGFALLSKQYLPVAKGGAPMLEYRISGQDRGALAALLTAADYAGLTLWRVDSLPDPYFEDGYVYHAVLSVGEGNAALLHDYLTAALPRAALVGAYTYLKEGK